MHHDLLKVDAVGASSVSTRRERAPESAIVADARPPPRCLCARKPLTRPSPRAYVYRVRVSEERQDRRSHGGFYHHGHDEPRLPRASVLARVRRRRHRLPSNADIVVKRGTVEEWYLINATMESHAFHIHQMSFVQEKSWAGMPLTADTVFVPVGRPVPESNATRTIRW